jgi:hypothetical protein
LPEPGALAAAALLAIVPSLLYVVVLNAIDRYEKEPWTILLASLGLGAVAAPVLSVLILAAAGRPATLQPDFATGPGGADALVGIVEELVKGGLLILLIRSIRDEFDDVIDGIVYGAALGAGFGATESLFYTAGGVQGLGPGTIDIRAMYPGGRPRWRAISSRVSPGDTVTRAPFRKRAQGGIWSLPDVTTGSVGQPRTAVSPHRRLA